MLLARERGEVVISEAFARKHSLGRGDSVSIPTPAGPVEFVVSAVYTDFSSEQGYVIMDRLLYLQHFADPLIDSIAVYLAQDADSALVRREIDQVFAAADGAPAVIVRANTDLRTFALEAFDRTFAITTILKVIAIVVSILGVASTLLAQVLDRRAEIMTLRTIGASVRRVIVGAHQSHHAGKLRVDNRVLHPLVGSPSGGPDRRGLHRYRLHSPGTRGGACHAVLRPNESIAPL
jgi:putative ABC transport system permease protein